MANGAGRPSLRLTRIEEEEPSNASDDSEKQEELVLTWKNYGRAPATVTRIGIGTTIAAAPPHVPMYRFFEGPSVNANVERGDEYKFRVSHQILAISPDQRKQIELGVVYPWLWGEIRYEDALGGAIESGFVAIRDGGVRIGTRTLLPPRWRLRGPANYIYTRAR